MANISRQGKANTLVSKMPLPSQQAQVINTATDHSTMPEITLQVSGEAHKKKKINIKMDEDIDKAKAENPLKISSLISNIAKMLINVFSVNLSLCTFAFSENSVIEE